MRQIPIFYGACLEGFDFGPGHPFDGSRFRRFMETLDAAGLLRTCNVLEPRRAARDDLALVHSTAYLETLEGLKERGGWLTLDTPVTPGAYDAQKAISGSALQALELLLADDAETAHTFGGFHHAGRDYGEGFCYFNDVALAAAAALELHGLKRIMILDTDAHQGNGTMDIFYDDARVLFVSVHQDPATLYPGRGFVRETGSGEGEGFTVNIPMPRFSGWKQYSMAFERIIFPIARQFRPDLMIRNGGSDPLHADELTALGMDLDGLNRMGRTVRGLAGELDAPLLDMMVSGYGDYVVEGWLALFCGIELLDADYRAWGPPLPPPPGIKGENLDRATDSMLKSLERELEGRWELE